MPDPDPTRPGIPSPDPRSTDPQRPDPQRPDPQRPNPEAPEPEHPETTRSENARPEPPRSGPALSRPAHSGPADANAVHPDPGRPDTGQGDQDRTASLREDPTAPGAARGNAAGPDASECDPGSDDPDSPDAGLAGRVSARVTQLVLAVVFLTRLPLGRFLGPRLRPLAQAAWAFPLAGLVAGTLAAVPLWLVPGLLGAALSVAAMAWLTGALHEDALADFADAGGGRDVADRLRIMRDSTIGSYGATALLATLLLRVAALSVLGPAALIGAAALGRAAPVWLMRAMPPARGDGLGQGAGRPSMRAVAGASLIGAAAMIAAAPGAAPAALALAGLSALLVARRARLLVGGQTGDILGASVLLAETAALVALAAAI